MKKSLIALAVASAVSAPAFAATSNVDIYGKLHVSVSAFNDQDAAAEDLQISSNASRIGFKGAEDLGGGLSAIWQIESGVNLDEQAGTLASRNSFVGLKGGFGTVLIGNHDTPLKLVGRAVDLFGDTMADSRNVMIVESDRRADNVVAYMSPSFSGLAFAATYTTDADTTTGNNGDAVDASAWNANATYTNGPLYLGLGFGDGDALENAGIDNEWRLAAGFTFGGFKVVGQYDKSNGDDVLANDYEAWMVGAGYTMGNVVLKANYMEGEVDVLGGAEPKQWTVGADYNLSKRTTVYALYADGEDVVMGGGTGSSDRVGPEVAGGDVSMVSLGVIHNF